MTPIAFANMQRIFQVLTGFTLCLSLAACSEEEKADLPFLTVNHTDTAVVAMVINRVGGPISSPPQGGGGSTDCCVTVPKHWRPDLKVTVKWQEDGRWLKDASGKEVIRDGKQVLVEAPWKSATVSVPEYTDKDLGHFDVHFMPGDMVQVKVSYLYPEHPSYLPAYPKSHKAQP